jgi:cytosine permease
MRHKLAEKMEDHALERVPAEERKNWLAISWNTTGLVTSIAILFFGALVCFVAGVKIALLAGLVSFLTGSAIGWAIAKVAYTTGCSNTLITRQHGLGVRGSAVASLIFGFLIIGFLALENALLYKGCLFFFQLDDTWLNKIIIYGGLTSAWIFLTAFGFDLVARFSSIMIIAFLLVMAYILWVILGQSGTSLEEAVLFGSQLPPEALASIGVHSDIDKFIFSLNILLGPSCAIALNTADFGRYGKSVADVGVAATIGVFFQSLLIALVGGVLVYAGSSAMVEHYVAVDGLTQAQAHQEVLKSPGSIAATFIVFGGFIGFLLMMVAQAKAQVLNTYSSSLCVANLADALFKWRPGRVWFVVIANIIALLMLYGHLLELVEAWIKLLGVLLSSLAGVIIADYYIAAPIVKRRLLADRESEQMNWAGLITIVVAVLSAHYLIKPYQPIEVFTSLSVTLLLYPALRLTLLSLAAR